MNQPLRLLLVEDNPDDADLLLAELRRGGFAPEWERVDTEEAFLRALEKRPDIVISDYSMPGFSGLRAAELLHGRELDIPFILVSGTVGEEVAVAAMRQGATDYLLKDRTARLGSSVTRALREARARHERAESERALRQAQVLLQKTLEHSPVVIYSLHVDGARVALQMVNENITRLLGHTIEDAMAVGWWSEHVHPEDLERQTLGVAETLAGNATSFEYRFRHKRGHYVWLEDQRRTIRGADGQPVEISGAWTEVTDRKLAAIELSKVNRDLALILDSVDEGIYGLDLDGRITFANSASMKILGWPIDEFVGASAHDLVHHTNPDGSPLPLSACRIEATLRDGVPRRVDNEVFWRKTRASFPVEYVVAPKMNDDGGIVGAVVVFHDIAERRNLEAQFRQSQKLESIGQLAGGIAHDFNNILSAIMLQAELVAGVDQISPEVKDGLNAITQSAERASNLTRQLLLFSRKQVMQTRQLDLNEVARSLVSMLRRIIPEDVDLELRLHHAPLLTDADAGMIDQVLLNLTVNARDAMPKGGLLVIETCDAFITPEQAAVNPDSVAGPCVCLSVSDAGTGIPPEVRSRMFEPFFTTKEPGKGTGLGLATVFGVVKQHHGLIDIWSELGKGTVVRVLLPVSHKLVANGPVAAAAAAPHACTERVLVAEDDAAVRKLTRIVLEMQGYTVLEAKNAATAIELYHAHEGNIDLLLTDIVMPGGMDGRELATRLQQERPALKVLFTSGYSSDIAGRELKLQAGQSFIAKPTLPHQLLLAVRRSLGE